MGAHLWVRAVIFHERGLHLDALLTIPLGKYGIYVVEFLNRHIGIQLVLLFEVPERIEGDARRLIVTDDIWGDVLPAAPAKAENHGCGWR